MPDDYNLKNRPLSVPLEQWKILIKFWKSNIAKVIDYLNFIIYVFVLVYLSCLYLFSFHIFIIKVSCKKNKTSIAKFTTVRTTRTKNLCKNTIWRG